MNKIIALIFLTMSVNSIANSNWVYVASSINNEDWFVERNSTQKDGDSVTFWTRRNYVDRTKFGDLSEKVQRTINCRRREVIIRFMQTYDDINNTGRQTSSFKANDSWEPVAPDTVMWTVMRFVCK